MRSTRGRFIGGLIALVVVLTAAMAGLMWRQVYVEKLNRKLIAAIRANDTRQVIALLERGADANAHAIPHRKLSLLEILMEVLHHKTDSSHAPSALQLALDWRPDADAAVRPTVQDTPLIQALTHHGAELGGREILARMARTYAFCSSYQDTGHVQMNVQSDQFAFQTAFVRPNRFYFEYSRSPEDRYAVWENKAGVQSWLTGTAPTQYPRLDAGMSSMQYENLESALGNATGAALGTAARIPGALMAGQMDGWGGLVLDYSEVQVDGMAQVDGVACYKLIPKETALRPVAVKEIDVDAKSFLLRKIVETYPESNDSTVTLYSPRVDLPISASTFEFRPPQQKNKED